MNTEREALKELLIEMSDFCKQICNSSPDTPIKGAIESKAFYIGHHPFLLNPDLALSNKPEAHEIVSQETETITKVVIDVEKQLCKLLGRDWSAAGISIETLIAALQKRIEELEAVISKKDEIFREILSANTKLQAENLATDALTIKAGDVQAPKVKDEIEELERALRIIGVVGKIDGYDVIRRDSVIDIVRGRIKNIIADIPAAAPTDTEGK